MASIKGIYKFDYSRPLVFLCGCKYYENDTDRRYILKQWISKNWYDKNEKIHATPIIIDKILDSKDVKEHGLKINLLEEIMATISYRTYILLDTMSTAYELGQFSNFYADNKFSIFTDNQSTSRINCSIGEYITKSFDNHIIQYSAKYNAQGFIFFDNNSIPIEIENKLNEDSPLKNYKIESERISFVTDQSRIIQDAVFSYYVYGSNIYFTSCLRNFFYFIAACIEKDLDEDIKNTDNTKIDKLSLKIKKELLNTFVTTIGGKLARQIIGGELNVVINIGIFSFNDILVHIYYLLRQFKLKQETIGSNEYIFSKNTHEVIKIDNLNDFLFPELMRFYSKNSYLYGFSSKLPVEKKTITINKKTRSITKYENNFRGSKYKYFHSLLNSDLLSLLDTSNLSFAYKRNQNIKKCIEKHIGKKYFIKLDISHYFESIKKNETVSMMESCISNKINETITFVHSTSFYSFYSLFYLLDFCFYKRLLPIGFTTSPRVSDYFLYSLDQLFEKDEEVIYTRYADDILISSNDYEKLNNALMNIKSSLRLKGLSINQKKLVVKKLINDNDSIKFLGLNLVKRSSGFSITVSTSYLKETRNKIFNYFENFRDRQKLLSRISYIKYISNESYLKLNKMVSHKFKDISDIETNIKRDIPLFKRIRE